MLLIFGMVVVLIAVGIIPGIRMLGGESANTLGWMSEQWIAEHRASHSE